MNIERVLSTVILVCLVPLSACSPASILKPETVNVPSLETTAGRERSASDTIQQLVRVINTPPRLTILTPSFEVQQGSAVDLRPDDTVPDSPVRRLYTAQDAEDGIPALSIVSSLDGRLPIGEYRFRSPGRRVLTITATDTAGATQSAQLEVMVGP